MNGLRPRFARGFTLIELLASMAILAMITSILFAVFGQVSKAWTQGESRTEAFSSARLALDLIGRELETAIVSSNNALGLKEQRFDEIIDRRAGTNARQIRTDLPACAGDRVTL